MSNDPRHSLGKMGEDLACAELGRRGYAVIARGYRTKYGEIDIVARDGETTVFVEVKTRAGDEYGGAAAAVTQRKQRRVAQMAVDSLSCLNLLDMPCRLDDATVDVIDLQAPLVELYPQAFESAYQRRAPLQRCRGLMSELRKDPVTGRWVII